MDETERDTFKAFFDYSGKELLSHPVIIMGWWWVVMVNTAKKPIIPLTLESTISVSLSLCPLSQMEGGRISRILQVRVVDNYGAVSLITQANPENLKQGKGSKMGL